jgi:TolB-like protein
VSHFTGRLPQYARIAVLPIQANTPEFSKYMVQKINAALVNSRFFIVVERDFASLDAISREMLYQQSEAISNDTTISIGKQLGAEYIISGSMSRAGTGYTLELKTVDIETAHIAAQWSAANIRPDPAWSGLDRTSNIAALSFSGAALSEVEKQTLENGLRRGLEIYKVALELEPLNALPNGYAFTIGVSVRQLPPSPPANTLMQQGEFSVQLSRGGRILRRTEPYIVTENSLHMLIRRGAEEMQNDRAFFIVLKETINP